MVSLTGAHAVQVTPGVLGGSLLIPYSFFDRSANLDAKNGISVESFGAKVASFAAMQLHAGEVTRNPREQILEVIKPCLRELVQEQAIRTEGVVLPPGGVLRLQGLLELLFPKPLAEDLLVIECTL